MRLHSEYGSKHESLSGQVEIPSSSSQTSCHKSSAAMLTVIALAAMILVKCRHRSFALFSLGFGGSALCLQLNKLGSI